jgi:hypothetical protein
MQIQPSTRASGITRFVQGECWCSLQMSTNGHAWKRACNCLQRYREDGEAFLQQIVTDDEICVHCYEPASKLIPWSGNTCHRPGARNPKVCLLTAKWCWHCFGTLMVLSSSTTRIMDRPSIVHGIELCLKRRWNPLFTVNAEECR